MKRKRIINTLAAILIACGLAAGLTTTTALASGGDQPTESISLN